jgi:hypothetical protein
MHDVAYKQPETTRSKLALLTLPGTPGARCSGRLVQLPEISCALVLFSVRATAMNTQDIEVVQSLLANRSAREIRAICVEALRRWRQAEGRDLRVAQMHGALGLYAVKLMLEDRPNPSVNPIVAKEVFLVGQTLTIMAPVMDFVWWMIRAGLAWPELFPISQGAIGHQPGNQLVSLHLTDDGLRFLDSADDHPLAPGFLKRLRARHPEVPDSVMVLLEDTQACLDVSLYRPAVVLLGWPTRPPWKASFRTSQQKR